VFSHGFVSIERWFDVRQLDLQPDPKTSVPLFLPNLTFRCRFS
jgi:hypothetical protein